ncbi:hypothetical protein cypCar_00024804 [Cyprinus carpio]|nr:hypothetical protein cypCar_00024804 [Cyprinus carpio]
MGCNKVCVALVGALVVITLIAIPTAIYVNRDESAFKRTYSFNDFYNDTIRYKTYSLHWISDNEYLHKTSEGHIYLHNVETKESSMYLSNSTFAQVDATDYILSGDKRFVVFESNYSKVWRHSFTASYHMYNMESREFLSKVQIPPVTQLLVWAPVENKLAGCVIPRARLFVIDVENPSRQSEVLVPKSVGVGDHYLRTVTWVTDERLAVQWLPRRQDSKFEQKSKTGWVGRYFPAAPYFAANNMSFYKVMSNDNGYKHLHYVEAGKAKPITSGKWEVIYISKVTKDSIYYVSNEHMGRPGQRNLYKISISKSGHSAPECLTCSLYQDRCQYNSAYFSLNASFFRMDCYGPGLPLFTLMDNRGPAKEIQVLEDNKKLEKILTTELLMPTIKRATMKIAGFNLWYQMMFPPNFDSSKKYPLLIQVYGGPASQNTDYVFRLEWATYLCSTEKVIIASFDGRGSGFQGDELMHAIYGRLGTYEVEDQISAVRKFIEMGFIDKDRIGMWGWSYGGYVTSMVLGSGSGLFKCGIAVAPVAKWDYYDAVYTERYMHRPEENTESYKNSTVTDRAKNFKSVQYMLVHGTADDNVHFQQAAQISKALVENQVDFEAMWYTDKDHGLSGKARYHLYAHLNHFLQNCFAEKK